MLVSKNIICVQSELGGPVGGAALGPRALLNEIVNEVDFNIVKCINTDCLPIRKSAFKNAHYLNEINDCLEDISNSVFEYYSTTDQKLTVLAGDHSTACGSLAGLKRAFPTQKIGVIWIDAHADIHSPYTTPSGNVHGMPVSAAIGLDHLNKKINNLDKAEESAWLRTKEICRQSVKCEDLVYIGIRDLEEQEWDIIKENNILYYTPKDMDELGAKKVASSVIDHLNKCDVVYLSFDIDSMDKSLVPGTGTPVELGLKFAETSNLLKTFINLEKTKLVEIVEINPLLDNKNETAKLIKKLIIE